MQRRTKTFWVTSTFFVPVSLYVLEVLKLELILLARFANLYHVGLVRNLGGRDNDLPFRVF